MNGDTDIVHPRTLLGAALAVLSSVGQAPDSRRAEWLRNPAMGHYKAHAECRMGRYAEAREVWETLAEAGSGDALFHLGLLAEEGLGEPRNLRKAEALYTRAAQAGNGDALATLATLGQAAADQRSLQRAGVR